MPALVLPVTVTLANVFGPNMLGVTNAVEVKVTLLNVTPSIAFIPADTALTFICDVPALNVKLGAIATAPKFIAVVADKATVLEPKLIVLVLLLVLRMEAAVRLYVEQEKEPFVTVMEEEPLSNALPSVHAQSTPFTSRADAIATPFVVNVFPVVDPDNVMFPVNVRVNPVAGSVTLP